MVTQSQTISEYSDINPVHHVCLRHDNVNYLRNLTLAYVFPITINIKVDSQKSSLRLHHPLTSTVTNT